MGSSTESQRRMDALSKAIQKMKGSTSEAALCCDQLTKRARQLDSLTSPASDASSMLSKASNNLGATLVIMKDAREKFDTVRDCEPAIERLHRGVLDLQREKSGAKDKARRNPFEQQDAADKGAVVLSEQDIYAAADSMEIIRDAYEYFIERKHWRSTTGALSSLERVHQMGVSSMCILQSFHLLDAGQAVRLKRVVKQEGEENITPGNETAHQVRQIYMLDFTFLWTICHFILG
jgi:exocyst complex protein 7